MSRDINHRFGPHAQEYLENFHPKVVQEVIETVENNDVVVIGMFLNTSVTKVRKALTDENIEYAYLEYGGYFSKWKARLAIKLWSGWPTYPQVFVKGQLMGGNVRTRKALADGSLQSILSEE